jgi:transcription elongation factor SPT6
VALVVIFLNLISCYRALQEAQDIFGVDFNFEEFDEYNEEDEFEEDEDYEEDEEVGEDGEPRVRAKKQKKRATKKSIFDVSFPCISYWRECCVYIVLMKVMLLQS